MWPHPGGRRASRNPKTNQKIDLNLEKITKIENFNFSKIEPETAAKSEK